jgi:hypothetical protein
LELNLKKVAAYIRQAETESLLDRVTVFRDGMEPAALDLIEGELSRRGVSLEKIAEYGELRSATVVINAAGEALRCHFCERPAIVRGRGWFKLWRRIPIFPRMYSRCEVH